MNLQRNQRRVATAGVIAFGGGPFVYAQPQVATPVITLLDTDPDSFTITTATAGATIHYTVDPVGVNPTGASTTYTAAFVPPDSAQIIRAIGIKAGAPDSAIPEFSYTPANLMLHLPITDL